MRIHNETLRKASSIDFYRLKVLNNRKLAICIPTILSRIHKDINIEADIDIDIYRYRYITY